MSWYWYNASNLAKGKIVWKTEIENKSSPKSKHSFRSDHTSWILYHIILICKSRRVSKSQNTQDFEKKIVWIFFVSEMSPPLKDYYCCCWFLCKFLAICFWMNWTEINEIKQQQQQKILICRHIYSIRVLSMMIPHHGSVVKK